jgi:hypothetical protein
MVSRRNEIYLSVVISEIQSYKRSKNLVNVGPLLQGEVFSLG